jgi:hypothetical protein
MHAWILYLCLAAMPDKCVAFAERPTYQACHEFGEELEIRHPSLYAYCVRRPK